MLQAGEPITVVHRPGHGVTVSTMFRALTTERSLLPQLRSRPSTALEAEALRAADDPFCYRA